MSSVFKDMDQDDRPNTLERKVKKLERNVNGGSKMSGIIKDLIGMECTIDHPFRTLHSDHSFQ